MATLALSAAGAAAGGALLPGLSVLGIGGAALGRAVGALAGAAIDDALFDASGQATQRDGPRLSSLQVLSSTEGAAIPRLYGRARLAGEVIWATHLEEESRSGQSGGKTSGTGATGRTFSYYASFAVGLCEGPITRIGRIWADGAELDQSAMVFRLHRGTEDQLPDSLIEAKQGAGNAPAYRGLAYIVFERLPLAPFGNRIPQLNFEVFRSVDDFEGTIRAVTLIPGAGEFAYAPQEVLVDGGAGSSYSANRHTGQGASDFAVAMDQLQATLPNARTVSLYAAWFGDSLAAGACSVRPKVEARDKGNGTQPISWSAAGLARADAAEVSRVEGRPAYGGSPADATLVAAIRDMAARGLDVVLTPFLLMDMPGYPWRGRITGSDGAAAALAEIAAFVGSASPGASEWSYRRFILHMASLAAEAGGVAAFVIGSEMRGLTTLRDETGAYPFVAALVQLAADVKAILPDAAITYAADWSEWSGHQTGGGDIRFHLDPLWACAAIDAISIDFYPPLADQRAGEALRIEVAGGEGYDWYYASPADRIARNRTPITDGAYGKPWVYRTKDLRSWWNNPHFDRVGGVESASPTAWLPRSKPIWLTEIGCPAVDKGANQPNVFVDPKSSESALPHFSSGQRDDATQRAAIRAVIEHFEGDAANPPSDRYAGRMVDTDRIFVYTWDARPSPVFPAANYVWADGVNWALGHWISGRAGEAPLGKTLAALLRDGGVPLAEPADLPGSLSGYVLERPIALRDAVQPLETAYFFDAVESGDRIVFRPRGQSPAIAIAHGALVDAEAPLTLRRAQETDLPQAAKLTYIDGERDYQQGVAEARRADVASRRLAQATLPIVTGFADCQARAATWLHESWAGRETASFSLPPSRLALEPGDCVQLQGTGAAAVYRITGSYIGAALEIDAQSVDPHIYGAPRTTPRPTVPVLPVVDGPVVAVLLDLPPVGDDSLAGGALAAFAMPWSGAAFWRSPTGAGFALHTLVDRPATLGETLTDLAPGPTSRWDDGNALIVQLYGGALASADDAAVLAGANRLAVRSADGWEVLHFARAELVAASTYRLSRLLRGAASSEAAMARIAAGARCVLLDEALNAARTTLDELGREFVWKIGPARVDISHPAYRTVPHTFQGAGLRPLAPAHGRARRDGGAVELSWVRRTRIGGDSWELAEVPLGETREAYRVLLEDAAGAVLVTLEALEPRLRVVPPAGAVRARVAQLSETVGPGHAAIITLP